MFLYHILPIIMCFRHLVLVVHSGEMLLLLLLRININLHLSNYMYMVSLQSSALKPMMTNLYI